MVWGTAKGRTCLPSLAVQIQAPRLASDQMLTVPLGSTVGSCTVPCLSLRTPASRLCLGCTPDESQHTQSPLPPDTPVSRHAMGTSVARHQSRTNLGAPRGQGVPWLAREGGRQPGYLESRDLDLSHPRKPALCLAKAETIQRAAGRGHGALSGSSANPRSIDGAARSPGGGLGGLAATMEVVKKKAPRVLHRAPHDPAAKRCGGWSD